MDRARHRFFSAWLLIIAVAGLLLGCDLFAPASPTPTSPLEGVVISATAAPTPADCSANQPPPAIQDARFDALFASHPNSWLGADGAYSVPLPDGRSAWLFGDTILGQPQADGSLKPSAFINNSIIVQDGDKLTALHGGSNVHPAAMITPTNPATWYWPGGGLVEGNKLRVFLLQLKRAGNGAPGFDFTGIGHAIATLSLPDLKVEAVAPLPFVSKVDYGGSFVAEGNYTYIYGLEDLQGVKYGHVARVAQGQLVTGKWQFYDGANWSSDPLSSTRIISDVSNLSVFKHGKGYVLVGMETGFGFGKNILAYYSCSPTGPWTGRTVLYTVPEATGSVITYLAIAHPEFSKDGTMLISYCLNDTKPQGGFVAANVYRPHFVRVSFAP